MLKQRSAVKVFLNYEAADREYAKDLAARLSDAGLDVFDPLDDTFPGDNWPLKVGQALQKANAMVVLLSPEAGRSELVRRGVQFATGSLKFRRRLVSVMVRPTRDFPPVLRQLPLVKAGKDRADAADQILGCLQ